MSDSYAQGTQTYTDNYQVKENWSNAHEMEFEHFFTLTGADRVMIGIIGGIAFLFGCVYWILCMVWAYRKAVKIGKGTTFWTILTLFFNLYAIAALYIYAALKGTCKTCGHLREKNAKFCSACGQPFVKECKECGSENSFEAKYCIKCGKEVK